MTNVQQKCPKCGAAPWQQTDTHACFECHSLALDGVLVFQSSECVLRERDALLATMGDIEALAQGTGVSIAKPAAVGYSVMVGLNPFLGRGHTLAEALHVAREAMEHGGKEEL